MLPLLSHMPMLPPSFFLALQIKKLLEDTDGHKAAAAEFARGLDTITRSTDASAMQRELGDTVRRMAVVQVCALVCS
jgi:hypothetical protein